MLLFLDENWENYTPIFRGKLGGKLYLNFPGDGVKQSS